MIIILLNISLTRNAGTIWGMVVKHMSRNAINKTTHIPLVGRAHVTFRDNDGDREPRTYPFNEQEFTERYNKARYYEEMEDARAERIRKQENLISSTTRHNQILVDQNFANFNLPKKTKKEKTLVENAENLSKTSWIHAFSAQPYLIPQNLKVNLPLYNFYASVIRKEKGRTPVEYIFKPVNEPSSIKELDMTLKTIRTTFDGKVNAKNIKTFGKIFKSIVEPKWRIPSKKVRNVAKEFNAIKKTPFKGTFELDAVKKTLLITGSQILFKPKERPIVFKLIEAPKYYKWRKSKNVVKQTTPSNITGADSNTNIRVEKDNLMTNVDITIGKIVIDKKLITEPSDNILELNTYGEILPKSITNDLKSITKTEKNTSGTDKGVKDVTIYNTPKSMVAYKENDYLIEKRITPISDSNSEKISLLLSKETRALLQMDKQETLPVKRDVTILPAVKEDLSLPSKITEDTNSYLVKKEPQDSALIQNDTNSTQLMPRQKHDVVVRDTVTALDKYKPGITELALKKPEIVDIVPVRNEKREIQIINTGPNTLMRNDRGINQLEIIMPTEKSLVTKETTPTFLKTMIDNEKMRLDNQTEKNRVEITSTSGKHVVKKGSSGVIDSIIKSDIGMLNKIRSQNLAQKVDENKSLMVQEDNQVLPKELHKKPMFLNTSATFNQRYPFGMMNFMGMYPYLHSMTPVSKLETKYNGTSSTLNHNYGSNTYNSAGRDIDNTRSTSNIIMGDGSIHITGDQSFSGKSILGTRNSEELKKLVEKVNTRELEYIKHSILGLSDIESENLAKSRSMSSTLSESFVEEFLQINLDNVHVINEKINIKEILTNDTFLRQNLIISPHFEHEYLLGPYNSKQYLDHKYYMTNKFSHWRRNIWDVTAKLNDIYNMAEENFKNDLKKFPNYMYSTCEFKFAPRPAFNSSVDILGATRATQIDQMDITERMNTYAAVAFEESKNIDKLMPKITLEMSENTYKFNYDDLHKLHEVLGANVRYSDDDDKNDNKDPLRAILGDGENGIRVESPRKKKLSFNFNFSLMKTIVDVLNVEKTNSHEKIIDNMKNKLMLDLPFYNFMLDIEEWCITLHNLQSCQQLGDLLMKYYAKLNPVQKRCHESMKKAIYSLIYNTPLLKYITSTIDKNALFSNLFATFAKSYARMEYLNYHYVYEDVIN